MLEYERGVGVFLSETEGYLDAILQQLTHPFCISKGNGVEEKRVSISNRISVYVRQQRIDSQYLSTAFGLQFSDSKNLKSLKLPDTVKNDMGVE